MTTKITPRVGFTILNKQMTKINTPAAKAFFVFCTMSQQIGIQQSHITNPLLTMLLSLYGKVLDTTKKPQAILSRTDLPLG